MLIICIAVVVSVGGLFSLTRHGGVLIRFLALVVLVPFIVYGQRRKSG